MKIERPQFELMRVYADGTSDAPEIVPVSQMPWDTKMERRGFLGVGVGVASVLALSESACSSRSSAPLQVPEKILKAHINGVYTLAISPDGKTLASSSADETIKLWSLPDGKLLATLEGDDRAHPLAINSDSKTLASSSSYGRTIKLWSLPDGRLFAALDGHKNRVRSLVISPDGKI